MTRPDVLFSTYAWDAVVDAQRTVLRSQVQALGGDYLDQRDPDALAALFAQEHGLAVPAIFPDRITVTPASACGDPAHDFALLRAAVSQDAVFQAQLPFEGDPGLFHVSPAERPGPPPPPGRVGQGFVELTVAGSGLTPEIVLGHARRWSETVRAWLAGQTAGVGAHDEAMRRFARTLIQRRIDELSAEADLWAGLEMIKRQPAA